MENRIMISALLGLFLFVCSTQCRNVPEKLYRQCLGTQRSKLVDVEMHGCTRLPCQLWPGRPVAMNMTFVPTEDIEAGTIYIKGLLDGTTSKIEWKRMDLCTESEDVHLFGKSCPLRAGETVRINFSMLTPNMKYSMDVNLFAFFSLENDNTGEDEFCISVPNILQTRTWEGSEHE